MTLDKAREEIKFASQNCEEIGLGDGALSEDELTELEAEARRLLAGIVAYRAASSATGDQ